MAKKRPHPWEKTNGESNEWYAKFHIYLLLGPGRSMLGAYREYQRHQGKHVKKLVKGAGCPGAWDVKSKEYLWKARARAYDTHNQQADERIVKRLRRKKLRLTDAYLNKAQVILQLPVVRRFSEDGKTVIEPLPDATIRNAIELGQAGSRMGDEALGNQRADMEVNVNKRDTLDDDLEYLKSLIPGAAAPTDPPAPSDNGDNGQKNGDGTKPNGDETKE